MSESFPSSIRYNVSSIVSGVVVHSLVIITIQKLPSAIRDSFVAYAVETSQLTVRSEKWVQHYRTRGKCGSVGHIQPECPLRNYKYIQACWSCEIGFVFKKMDHTFNYGKRNREYRRCPFYSFQRETQKWLNDVILKTVPRRFRGSFVAQIQIQDKVRVSNQQRLQTGRLARESTTCIRKISFQCCGLLKLEQSVSFIC